jgi:hypothetical protein
MAKDPYKTLGVEEKRKRFDKAGKKYITLPHGETAATFSFDCFFSTTTGCSWSAALKVNTVPRLASTLMKFVNIWHQQSAWLPSGVSMTGRVIHTVIFSSMLSVFLLAACQEGQRSDAELDDPRRVAGEVQVDAESVNGDCSNTSQQRKAAILQVVKGNPLGALAMLEKSGVDACPDMARLVAQINGILGNDRFVAQFGSAANGQQCVANNDMPGDWRTHIRKLAADRQFVILNEAHDRSDHRAFAKLLAEQLRMEGYGYLAIEDLPPFAPIIQERGYLMSGDGFDLSESQFGFFIEHALALGYKLVPYEWIQNQQRGSGNPREDRERIQALNIIERTVGQDPNAKVLIYAGAGHARKDRGSVIKGEPTLFMAGWLAQLSSSEPLTITQTTCLANMGKALGVGFQLSVAPSPFDDQYDLAVQTSFFKSNLDQAVPEWRMEMGQKPISLDLEELASTKQLVLDEKLLVIEARRVGRQLAAVPADRVLVRGAEAVRPLYLPDGDYEISVLDTEGAILFQTKLSIE